ncbi:hypothetical protein [Treponema endosymbiont of Eucomonympha sp.]|uniref:hypothetical protein n=1 Tax=Treponema endosymbiont of Eucomonympha sp. TaxID=1580831 RepID=UPI0013969042|nr:hypothetical protein [Treponema endosymbiont of Eucomonympha sp.]
MGEAQARAYRHWRRTSASLVGLRGASCGCTKGDVLSSVGFPANYGGSPHYSVESLHIVV